MKLLFKFLISDPGRLILGGTLFIAAIILDVLTLPIAAFALYVSALIVSGAKVFYEAVLGLIRRDLLDEKFLMSIASIGAMIIKEAREGVAVMLFYLLGEMFEHMAVRKSRNKIRSLINICPDEATVIRDGEEITLDADEVLVSDTLIVRAGERLCCDAKVLSGSADVDTSSLTGESLPRACTVGDRLDSGVIILNGVLTLEVLRAADDSGAARIIHMVEEATERKAKEENFITSFSKIYTPIVVALAVLIAIIPPIFRIMSWNDSVYRALIFLVVSCPCALVISVPMAFFGGIGTSASRGILFKGASSFAPVSKVETVAFDKTGTLTNGEFEIKGTVCAALSKEELIDLMASVERGSNHPIAEAFRRACPSSPLADDVKEISGMGAVGYVKGARVAVGNARLMERENARIPDEIKNSGENLVFAAKDSIFIGAVIISDTMKPEAPLAIKALAQLGAKRLLVLSGDKKARAEELSKKVGIKEVHAQLLPEDKYKKLGEIIEETGGSTMYVGDGINDAPALTLADVGVAMGSVGSDSAIESADLVIVSDDLSRIPEAIRISRKTVSIAKQNIVFALGVKIAIMILGAFGIANMWLAVFADVGVAVLAILNSMRTLVASALKKK
ncbi:MAG: cadmium-translocating P-type ATPase [Clostridia bacterium]|nr:cadmium-translocating P-type ATPase [Clostridia bacterium]